MYEFLTGPMLWAAFLIFVIGLARRVVLYIRGLIGGLNVSPTAPAVKSV